MPADQVQSAFAPAALTTLVHFATSARKNSLHASDE
jgi:hypothetical protein